MTKVTILGQGEVAQHEPKKIEFACHLDSSMTKRQPLSAPYQFKNLELICFNYKGCGQDLMFAYDKDRNDGFLYLGHFNDGVV